MPEYGGHGFSEENVTFVNTIFFIMKILIHTLVSPLHDKVSTERAACEFLGNIQSYCGSGLVNCGNDFSSYGQGDLSLVYVMTGGTEGLFLEALPQIQGHVHILTSGRSNSLAASMEILSYLRQQGRTGEIIHGDAEYIAHRVELLAKVDRARKNLQGMRLGVIGEPSDWLIASAPDEAELQQRLGMELVRVPIAELIAKLEGISQDREKGAEEIYHALKGIVAQYNLQGLTLRCFDLLGPLRNTGCLALARLNAEGIPASCEGDIPALVTMAVGHALTGQCGFQANPSRIDPSAGEYLFAHCTVPLNMVRSYEYDTHFESGLGVAIRGVLPEGNATIFKLSGDLSRSFVAPAQLLRNQAEPGLCRTQVVLRAEGCAEYFLNGPIGNHHIIFCGDYNELFKAFVSVVL